MILETPEENFYDLSGFAYESNSTSIVHQDLPTPCTMESVVAGPKKGQEVLLIHGGTSWVYGFRHMIPILAEAGCRVHAVDLLGFGRSTKFAEKGKLSHDIHCESLKTYLDINDIKNSLVVVFGESLPIALRLALAQRSRFRGMMTVNGRLSIQNDDYPLNLETFRDDNEVEVANIAQKMTSRHLHENILAGYEAPYPSAEFQWGLKQLVQSQFSKSSPFSVEEHAFDGVHSLPTWVASSSSEERIQKDNELLRSTAPFIEIKEARSFDGSGFYIEEDRGPELAHFILDILHDE